MHVSPDVGTEDAPLPPEEDGQLGLPVGADKEEKEAYLQKRMVDFLKRRVLVLEKVLNAEYHCAVCDSASLLDGLLVNFVDVLWPVLGAF